jgi:hypothetical protein
MPGNPENLLPTEWLDFALHRVSNRKWSPGRPRPGSSATEGWPTFDFFCWHYALSLYFSERVFNADASDHLSGIQIL